MTGLGPESRAILDAARFGDEPTEADREHIRAAIAVRLAASATAGIGALAAAKQSVWALVSGSGKSAVAAMPTGLVAKALVTSVAVLAIGGAMRAGRFGVSSGGHTPPTAAVPTGPIAAPQSPVPFDAPGPGDAPPIVADRQNAAEWTSRAGPPLGARARVRTSPAIAAPSSSTREVPEGADVAAEVRLLGEAHSAMHGGDPERALSLLDEHARRYPKGALGEERDATQVAALCALGRIAEAREAANRFLRATPRSPHAGPIRASCGGPSVTSAGRF